ncbi:MAG: T9SS type A sorting domain-containing protein [Bacteroidetes bacterium]|nr:T9SS type A sorting domain-containing protein [Bacteroidota bacterium]
MKLYLKIKVPFLFAFLLQTCLFFNTLPISKQGIDSLKTLPTCKENKGRIQALFPNPNNGEFYVTAQAPVILNVINSLGQLTRTVPLNASNNYKVPISNLANGIYYVVGEYKDQTIKQKIIVAK